jgi:hypothetical protein
MAEAQGYPNQSKKNYRDKATEGKEPKYSSPEGSTVCGDQQGFNPLWLKTSQGRHWISKPWWAKQKQKA